MIHQWLINDSSMTHICIYKRNAGRRLFTLAPDCLHDARLSDHLLATSLAPYTTTCYSPSSIYRLPLIHHDSVSILYSLNNFYSQFKCHQSLNMYRNFIFNLIFPHFDCIICDMFYNIGIMLFTGATIPGWTSLPVFKSRLQQRQPPQQQHQQQQGRRKHHLSSII